MVKIPRQFRLTRAMVALGLLVAVTLVPFGMKSLATPAHAATSVTGGQLFTTAGTGCQVTVSFISAEASFNDYLFLSSTVPPSGGTPTGTLLFNHGAPSGPTTISVPASSELIFAINVDNPSNGTGIDATWYMGPGTRNADGQPHAIVTDNGGGNFTVAFEDIAIPSQYTDYNDLVYSFQGSCLTANPHLSITKTATEKSYSAVGNVIHYTIVAKNDGNVTLPAVTVVDPKVSGLTCTPANGSSLAAGGTMTCTGTHTIVQADITAGHYANTACVDDGPGGATQACASADVPAVVTATLGKTKGYWGNRNGQAVIPASFTYTLGTAAGCHINVTKANSVTILPSANNGLSISTNCTPLDPGLSNGAVNNLFGQVLALKLNQQLISGFSTDTIGSLGCTSYVGASGLTAASTVQQVLDYANGIIGNLQSGGVVVTSTQVGTINDLLGSCMNREA